MMIQEILALVFLLGAAAPQDPATQTARVVPGPFPGGGDCVSKEDLVLTNGLIELCVSKQTRPRWNIPPGAVLDAAFVGQSREGDDLLLFFDLIPDNWQPWNNSFQDISVLEQGGQRATVKVVRNFGQIIVNTTYTLEAGATAVQISTTLTNNGELSTNEMATGYNLSASGAMVFSPDTLQWSNWVASCSLEHCVSLVFPDANGFEGGGTWRDMFRTVSLAAGESTRFDATLILTRNADTTPALSTLAASQGAELGTIRVQVPEARPELATLLISKDNTTLSFQRFTSTLFEVTLPLGTYDFQAVGPCGRTPIVTAELSRSEFRLLQLPDFPACAVLDGQVLDGRTQTPLDARITLPELKCEPWYICSPVRFTDPDRKGTFHLELPAGRHLLQFDHGAPFFSGVQSATVTLGDRPEKLEMKLASTLTVDPGRSSWYGLDMHHHALVFDGMTAPRDLVASTLAAGLQAILLSDHDSTAWHVPVREAAMKRGLAFLPSVELSPHWGHFNVFPLKEGAPLPETLRYFSIDEAALQAFSDMGGLLVQMNHPFEGGSGYLSGKGHASGIPGWTDLLELNGKGLFDQEDEQTFQLFLSRLADPELTKPPVFLVGGTDTHDVLRPTFFAGGPVPVEASGTGRFRTFAFVPGGLTAPKLVAAIAAGQSYFSSGPLMLPDVPPGNLCTDGNEDGVKLKIVLKSRVGLQTVRLYRNGLPDKDLPLKKTPAEATYTLFFGPAEGRNWVLELTDTDGNRAISNPWYFDCPKS